MAVMIESLIGVLLFTILIVSLTLKNPLTSVGDYPPVIREKCMELGLIGMTLWCLIASGSAIRKKSGYQAQRI